MRNDARPGARPVTVSVLPFTVKLTTSELLVATVYVPAVPSIIDSGTLTAVPSATVNCRACITVSGDAPPVDSAPTAIGLAPSERYGTAVLNVEPTALVNLIW